MEWESFIFLSKLMSSIIIIITIILILIYIRDEKFHDYPCYFNIFLSVVISLDNLFRVLPLSKKSDYINPSWRCKIQSFILIFLDKLVLFSITVYSIIQFLGVVKFKTYKKYQRLIFYLSLLISIISSLILGLIFCINHIRKTEHGHFCYVHTGDRNKFKESFDSIITSSLFSINLYCIIKILLFILKEINKKEERKKMQLNMHFWRFFIYLYLNSFTFYVAILLINESLFVQNESKHLTYVTLTFLVHLFYTLNMPALYGFINLVTCKKIEKRTITETSENLATEINEREMAEDVYFNEE